MKALCSRRGAMRRYIRAAEWHNAFEAAAGSLDKLTNLIRERLSTSDPDATPEVIEARAAAVIDAGMRPTEDTPKAAPGIPHDVQWTRRQQREAVKRRMASRRKRR